MSSWNPSVRSYLKDKFPQYVFVAVLLATGVVFGAFMVNALTLEQKQELGGQLGSFLHTLDQGADFDAKQSFLHIFLLHAKWLILIWVLGLSVVGLPFVFALDFMKGVLIGFTIGFMSAEYSWKGTVLALASVAPQNLIVIPTIVIGSVAALDFSVTFVKNRLLSKSGGIAAPFRQYCLTTLTLTLVAAGISLYESFVSPALIKWVSPMLNALGDAVHSRFV